MTKYIEAISPDMTHALLTDGRVVKVFALYDDNYRKTMNIQTATLVVVGPYSDNGEENQYVNADLTGTMSLAVH